MANGTRDTSDSGDTTIIMGGNFTFMSQHINGCNLHCVLRPTAQGCGQPQDSYGGGGNVDQSLPQDQRLQAHLDHRVRPPFSADDVDAVHSSVRRPPPPQCLLEARNAVLPLLVDWIINPKPFQAILWLYGPAGAGKSTIAQNLCEAFSREGGRIPASFFFGRGQAQRDRGELLASALSFQLVQNLPGYKKSLEKTLSRMPQLYSQSPYEQLSALLADTVKGIRRFSWSGKRANLPVIIIVDGLDECQGEAMQASIIESLHQISRNSNFELRFFITSRPEPHIQNAFHSQDIARVTRRVPLDDTFETMEAIRAYLLDRFQAIAEAKNLPNNWPDDGAIEILVPAARGHRFFAYLIIVFVSLRGRDPKRQLEIILDMTQNTAEFSLPAFLYTQILDTVPPEQRPILGRLLGCAVVLREPLPVATIADLVSVDQSTVLLLLDRVRAILVRPADGISPLANPLRFAHPSFKGYLTDRVHSGHYAIDQPSIHSLLVRRYQDHLIYAHLAAETPSNTPSNTTLFPEHTLSAAASAYFTQEAVRFHMNGSGQVDEDPVLGAMRLHLRRQLERVIASTAGISGSLNGVWSCDELVDIFATLAFQQRGSGFWFLNYISTLVEGCLSCEFPQTQLVTILDANRYHEARFPIDVLYAALLDTISSQQQPILSLFLGCVVVLQQTPPISVIADISSLDEADVQFALLPVRAVLTFHATHDTSSPMTDHLGLVTIGFVHDSFRDYLVDRTRSGFRAVDQEAIRSLITRRYRKHLIQCHLQETISISSTPIDIDHPNPLQFLSPTAFRYLSREPLCIDMSECDTDNNPALDGLRLHLCREIQRILDVVPGMPALPNGSWRYDEAIDMFVESAFQHGHFGFLDHVSSLIEHRLSSNSDPQEQLIIIFDASRYRSARHPVDILYTELLNNIPPHQQPTLRLILGLMAVLPQALPPAVISELLSLDKTAANSIFFQLRPVLCTASGAQLDSNGCALKAHPSFYTFLVDDLRSRTYGANQLAIHELLIRRYQLSLIHSHLSARWGASNGTTRSPNPAHSLSTEASAYLCSENVRFHANAARGVNEDPAAGALRIYLCDELQGNCLNVSSEEQRAWEGLFTGFVAIACCQGRFRFHLADLILSFVRHCISTLQNSRQTRARIVSDMADSFATKKTPDSLYTHILDNLSPDLRPALRRVLGCLVLRENLAIENIPNLVSAPIPLVNEILQQLPLVSTSIGCSVLEPTFSPADSFRDYLMDPSRSGQYAVDTSAGHRRLFLRWLKTRFEPSSALVEDDISRYLDKHAVFHGGMYDAKDLCRDLAQCIPVDFDPFEYRDGVDKSLWAAWGRGAIAGLQLILGAHTRKHGLDCPHLPLLARMGSRRRSGEMKTNTVAQM